MLVILVSWRALAMAVPTLAYLAPVFKKIKNKKNLRALIFWGWWVKFSNEARMAQAAAVDPLDTYDRIGKIGEGTYGVVFKAKDKRTNRLVALKQVFLFYFFFFFWLTL